LSLGLEEKGKKEGIRPKPYYFFFLLEDLSDSTETTVTLVNVFSFQGFWMMLTAYRPPGLRLGL
jgi:hypothetical protein